MLDLVLRGVLEASWSDLGRLFGGQDAPKTAHDGAKMGNTAERAQLASAASDASGALQMFLPFKVYFEVSKCSSGTNRFMYIFTGFV